MGSTHSTSTTTYSRESSTTFTPISNNSWVDNFGRADVKIYNKESIQKGSFTYQIPARFRNCIPMLTVKQLLYFTEKSIPGTHYRFDDASWRCADSSYDKWCMKDISDKKK
jgi:hypothetical protein